MQTQAQISFRDFPSSGAVESAIQTELTELEKYCDRITACRVVVSEPHRHQRKGRLFEVQINLAVPGEQLMVNHEHRLHADHVDAYLAIRDAFRAARRELEEYVHRMRRQVKAHEVPSHGRITRVLPWEDHGFISDRDGREFYFHRNSLLSGEFDGLQPGDEVSFLDEPGEKGPMAKSVRLLAVSRPDRE